ncbi:hypothetical protein GQR58_006703 [Nymphon striatum]|nr:hypothetical protein GQR58_006703 [Nymphon striatum]
MITGKAVWPNDTVKPTLVFKSPLLALEIKEMKTTLFTTAIAALFLSAPMVASASDCNYGAKAMKTNYTPAKHSQGGLMKVSARVQPDIVDTAISAGSFKTLVTAVKAAGLVGTLKGNGPYTVFRPN